MASQINSRLTWNAVLTGVVGVILIVCCIWSHVDMNDIMNTLTGVSDDLNTIETTLPNIVVLPDASPLDCARRVQTTIGSDVFVTKNMKPDGSICEDSCLSASMDRLCTDGVCEGTCAGTCPATFLGYDPACPVINVADAVYNNAGFCDIYFQVCVDGLCTYWVVFDTTCYPEFFMPGFLDWQGGRGPGMVEYAGTHLCPAFIDDADPSKGCLVSSFIAGNSLFGFGSPTLGVCSYAFDCGTASSYAGIGSGLGSMSVKSKTVNGKTVKTKSVNVAAKNLLDNNAGKLNTTLVTALETLAAARASGVQPTANPTGSRAFGASKW